MVMVLTEEGKPRLQFNLGAVELDRGALHGHRALTTFFTFGRSL